VEASRRVVRGRWPRADATGEERRLFLPVGIGASAADSVIRHRRRRPAFPAFDKQFIEGPPRFNSPLALESRSNYDVDLE